MLFLEVLIAAGQPNLWLGSSLGSNLTGIKRNPGMSEQSTTYQPGLNVNAILLYELSKRFRTMAQMGATIERYKTSEGFAFAPTQSTYRWTYSWAETIATIDYVPFQAGGLYWWNE